jgi:hypothetical protein
MYGRVRALAREYRKGDGRAVIIRRDTFARWLEVDPVLDDREVVWITDSPFLKVGDGLRKFSELPSWGPHEPD